MMVELMNTEQFLKVTESIIHSWCERKLLGPLSVLTGPYLAFNGLTDGWGELLVALKTVRANYRKDLEFAELRKLDDLIRIADDTVYRR